MNLFKNFFCSLVALSICLSPTCLVFASDDYSYLSVSNASVTDHCSKYEQQICTENEKSVSVNFELDEMYGDAISQEEGGQGKIQYCPTVFFAPPRLVSRERGKLENYEEYTKRLAFYPDSDRIKYRHILYSPNQTLVRFSKNEMDIAINKMCGYGTAHSPSICFEKNVNQLILVEGKVLCGEFDRLVLNLKARFKSKPYRHHLDFLLDLIKKRYTKPGSPVLNYDDILKKVISNRLAGSSNFQALNAILNNDLKGYAQFIIPSILKSVTTKWMSNNFKNPAVLKAIDYAKKSVDLARFSWIMLEIYKVNVTHDSNFSSTSSLLKFLTPFKIGSNNLPLTGADGYWIEDKRYSSAWFILDYIESITSVITGDILKNLKNLKKNTITNKEINGAFKDIKNKYSSELDLSGLTLK